MRTCIVCGKEFELKRFTNNDCCSIECKRQSPLVIFYFYKYHAKRREIKWNMTFEEFMTFWQKPCHYCGTEVKTIGLDRVNNEVREYNINNCVPCCSKCNSKKKTQSILKYYLKRSLV